VSAVLREPLGTKVNEEKKGSPSVDARRAFQT
jgi:hypothetical protein